MRKIALQIALLAGAVLVTATAAACDTNNARQVSASATSPAPVSRSTTAQAARPVRNTKPTSDPGDAKPCTFAHLAVTIDKTQGASGHISAAVHYRNTGTVNCWLSGYPAVVAVNQSGKRVDKATPTLRGYAGGLPAGDDTPSPYLLGPGDNTVSSIIETSSSCRSAPSRTRRRSS